MCPHPPVFPACDYEVQRIGQAVRLARVAHSDCGEHRVVARIPRVSVSVHDEDVNVGEGESESKGEGEDRVRVRVSVNLGPRPQPVVPDADRAVRAEGSKPVRGIGGKRDPLDSRSVVLANQQRLQVVHAQAVHEAYGWGSVEVAVEINAQARCSSVRA